MTVIDVVYENGVFKPKQPVNVPEGTEASVMLHGDDEAPGEGWRDTDAVKRRIEELAAMSSGHPVPPDVSTNADKYIYGEDDK